MRLKIKQFLLVLPLALLGLFLGCEKDDSEADFGEAKIYIPQSLSTGSNLNYLVPKGLDSASRNYIDDLKNDRIHVILGVSRSGKVSNDAFSVNIITRPDTIGTLITNNVLTNTVLLPTTMYQLSQSVAVADGKSSEQFLLSITRSQLKANFTGKKVALAIAITNPTKYALNPKNDKVIVIVDVNALKL